MQGNGADDITKASVNVCSTCGDLDNTIHICQQNRYQQELDSQAEVECDLKKAKTKLNAVLKKLRAAKHKSYALVGQVSEAERHLNNMIKAREIIDNQCEQLTTEALSESLKVIELLSGLPEDVYEPDSHSFDSSILKAD